MSGLSASVLHPPPPHTDVAADWTEADALSISWQHRVNYGWITCRCVGFMANWECSYRQRYQLHLGSCFKLLTHLCQLRSLTHIASL